MVDLFYDDLLEFVKIRKCHYCNDDIVWLKHRSENSKQVSAAYHLDRVDNSKTYSKDNCVVCCAVCNSFRGDKFTHDEMMEIGKTFRKLRENRHRMNLTWIKPYQKKENLPKQILP
jgi:hypothetical protein